MADRLGTRLRTACHTIGHRGYHFTESGCAVAYGIHEVFHFSAPVIILSYGLLAFFVITTVDVVMDVVIVKGEE